MGEMRSFRSELERQYYPWDPLQLSEEIDSGRRVRKNEVSFQTFRGQYKPIIWTSLQDKNFSVFSNSAPYTKEFLNQLLKEMKHLRESISVSLYDFSSEHEETLLSFDDMYSFVSYHPYKETFSHFLSQLLEHRTTIKKKTEKTQFSEGENKELQFIFIFLSGELQRNLLNNPLLKSMLDSLLNKSEKERLYLVVFGEAEETAPPLVPFFSHSYFIGDNLVGVMEKLFPNYEFTPNNPSQELVGFGVFPPDEKLVSLHWRKYTTSEWGLAARARKLEEEALYRAFLESKASE